jgi:hypothetical protein
MAGGGGALDVREGDEDDAVDALGESGVEKVAEPRGVRDREEALRRRCEEDAGEVDDGPGATERGAERGGVGEIGVDDLDVGGLGEGGSGDVVRQAHHERSGGGGPLGSGDVVRQAHHERAGGGGAVGSGEGGGLGEGAGRAGSVLFWGPPQPEVR